MKTDCQSGSSTAQKVTPALPGYQAFTASVNGIG